MGDSAASSMARIGGVGKGGVVGKSALYKTPPTCALVERASATQLPRSILFNKKGGKIISGSISGKEFL